MTQYLQAHSQTLYLVSLVLLCSVLLAIFLKACEALFVTRKMIASLSEASSGISVNVTGTSFLPASMVNKVLAVGVAMICLGLITTVWNIMDRFHRSELVELEKVHVDDRIDRTHFKMSVQTRPGSGKWTQFSATTCDPLEQDVVPGSVLCTFYYVIDPHQHCYDWNAKHAGYAVWRDQYNEPILTSVTGSIESCRTESATIH